LNRPPKADIRLRPLPILTGHWPCHRYLPFNGACKAIVGERLARVGVRHELTIRHLYHDREEVTAYLARND
jgi:23S rRNA C2498 (ribose-2'-O)-methylase RlmM